MDNKGTAIFSVWGGTVALSALLLYFDAIAEIVLLFWLTAIGLTVWLAQMKAKEADTIMGARASN
jgi:hypothetical protein